MRIGVDLDGVGYVFEKAYVDFLVYSGIYNNYKIPESQEMCCWAFHDCWGISRDEFIQHLEDAVSAGIMYSGGQYDGFSESINRLKDAGHTIHIATARRLEYATATIHWLAQHDVRYDTLDFVRDKTSVQTDIFVEDNTDNYDALEAAGVTSYLIDRTWNQAVDSRRRISGIIEFADIVLAKKLQSI